MESEHRNQQELSWGKQDVSWEAQRQHKKALSFGNEQLCCPFSNYTTLNAKYKIKVNIESKYNIVCNKTQHNQSLRRTQPLNFMRDE
jgi:hypothetical protein